MAEDSLFSAANKDVTPMMSQYLSVKSQYPGCLLLFRMGDFFEMFFEDAKLASSILNIALTHRGKHLNEDIPMCGIPIATLDNYVGRLVRAGLKVAVCDQMESPEEAKKRGYKAVVKREVTRIMTSGTIIEDNLLDSYKNNFLMSVVPSVNTKTGEVKVISFSAIDISTGDFFVNTVEEKDFLSLLSVYQPRELLVPYSYEKNVFISKVLSICDVNVSPLPDSKFNPTIEKERLEKYFNVKTLESFGITVNNEVASCGAILEYLLITQRDNFSSLPIPKKTSYSDFLVIDPSTVKSLEIISSSSGNYEYSLLGSIDKTTTSFGARMLATRVSMPVVDEVLLEKRLNCVDFFAQNKNLTEQVRGILSECPDIERAINRIRFNKFSPRDLGDVRSALSCFIAVKNALQNYAVPHEGEYHLDHVKDFSELFNTLREALIEKLPMTKSNVIADGYSNELDKLKYIKNHSEDLIADLQSGYISQTGISTLKIKNNAILGWYIEIPLSQKNKMTDEFLHRQTLVNAVRYTTDTLISLQLKFNQAFDEWSLLEQQIYAYLVNRVMLHYEEISYAIKVMSCLDIYSSFAYLAKERSYVRPKICSDCVLEIEKGRHPVLEIHEDEFSENDCELSNENRIHLLTGPNMAGKSTYLRQNALIVIMAQIGCYVPATRAVIGIVDRLFSRVGASDDLAKGRSTFMVEMIETATILNMATDKSFVILDEVGRGTSTYDGLSIAWAVIEHLSKKNRCRVLFATHYRELTDLQSVISNIKCKTLKVQEWNGDVIFYHKIIDGIADKSYGIHVASLAGVPKSVIRRATTLLKKFESQSSAEVDFYQETAEQMDLSYSSEKLISNKLKEINPNDITPKEALSILFDLKDML